MIFGHEDIEPASDIVKIEPNIWPFWELDNRDLRDDRRNKLEDELFQVIALIITGGAFFLVSGKDIYNTLPSFEDGFDQDIELHPRTEAFSIIGNPSAYHEFDSLDITEELSSIALFPGQVLLEFLRVFFVAFYDGDIFL